MTYKHVQNTPIKYPEHKGLLTLKQRKKRSKGNMSELDLKLMQICLNDPIKLIAKRKIKVLCF